MMITPRTWRTFRITPCQMRSPASVTTNAGTPTFATNVPCAAPMIATTPSAMRMQSQPGRLRPSGSCSEAAVSAAMPLRKPIERSISAISSTKTTPNAIIVTPAICRMMFTKFDAVKKFVAVKLKNPTMRISPITTGRTPRFPDLRFPIARCQTPSCSSESGGPRSGGDVDRAHATTPASTSATPATFVGTPAVMACTSSCCVVLARS